MFYSSKYLIGQCSTMFDEMSLYTDNLQDFKEENALCNSSSAISFISKYPSSLRPLSYFKNFHMIYLYGFELGPFLIKKIIKLLCNCFLVEYFFNSNNNSSRQIPCFSFVFPVTFFHNIPRSFRIIFVFLLA